MANDVSRTLDMLADGRHRELHITRQFDNLFSQWDAQKPPRYGWHLSSLINAPDKGSNRICYREHVFTRFYMPQETALTSRQLRTFLEGWYIHLKWQRLFKLADPSFIIPLEIEKTRHNELWDLYHTPDAVLQFPKITGDDSWIVEIKSMGTMYYKRVEDEYDPKKVHAKGYQQAQMYMYLTGAPHALLLLEDKNTQQFRVLCFDYDADFCAPYVHRINTLSQLVILYQEKEKAPKRICEHPDAPRAHTCPMREVCFRPFQERATYAIPETESTNTQEKTQVNASLFHEG